MNPTRKILLLKGILSGGGSRAINLLVTAITVPLLLNALSSESYAILAITLSVATLAAYSDLGIGLAIVNKIAQCRPAGTDSTDVEVVSTAFFALCAIAATLCCVGLLGAVAAVSLWNIPLSVISPYGAIVVYVSAGLPLGLSQRILFATERNVEANLVLTAGRVMSLLGILLAAQMGINDLLVYQFLLLGLPLVVSLLHAIFFFFRDSLGTRLRPRWSMCRGGLVQRLLATGGAFLFMNLLNYFETGSDPIFIALLGDVSVIPAYDVHVRLFGYIPALVALAAFPLWPAVTKAVAMGDNAWVHKCWRLGSYGSAAGATLLGAILVAFREPLVEAWTGQRLALDIGPVIGLWMFSVFTCVCTVQSMVLNGYSAIASQAKILLKYSVVLVAAKAVSIMIFGLAGLSCATAACCALRAILTWKLYHASKLDT